MIAIEVKPELQGFEALAEGQRRMVALGMRPRPIWEAVGTYGENSTRLRFKNQTDPHGKRWVPSIRVKVSGGQTLVQKARLLRSLSHNSDNSGTAWGTNVIYAGVHQHGAVIRAKSAGALRFRMPGGGFVSVKKVTIPARAFVGVNEEDGREIVLVGGEVVYNALRNPSQGTSFGKGDA